MYYKWSNILKHHGQNQLQNNDITVESVRYLSRNVTNTALFDTYGVNKGAAALINY